MIEPSTNTIRPPENQNQYQSLEQLLRQRLEDLNKNPNYPFIKLLKELTAPTCIKKITEKNNSLMGVVEVGPSILDRFLQGLGLPTLPRDILEGIRNLPSPPENFAHQTGGI